MGYINIDTIIVVHVYLQFQLTDKYSNNYINVVSITDEDYITMGWVHGEMTGIAGIHNAYLIS